MGRKSLDENGQLQRLPLWLLFDAAFHDSIMAQGITTIRNMSNPQAQAYIA